MHPDQRDAGIWDNLRGETRLGVEQPVTSICNWNDGLVGDRTVQRPERRQHAFHSRT
jgi:hypothetical protein